VDLKFEDKNHNQVPALPAERVKKGVNFYLNKVTRHIYITKVERVDGFHARFSAIERRYVYKIVSIPDFATSVFDGKRRWFVNKPLNIGAMQEACKQFIGTIDLSCFLPKIIKGKKSPIRTITECFLLVEEPPFPLIE